MESSLATFTFRLVGIKVIYSPILICTMLNLNRSRFFGRENSDFFSFFSGCAIIGLLSSYSVMTASSIVKAMSLKISRATLGSTLKNSLFCRIRKSVNRSIVLCTSLSTSLNLEVFIVAKISKGNGTAVLSNSFERMSTGRVLLPIFTQSSRKLGLVSI